MGYLICEKCKGYYELQQGESPEDFDRCQCGGDLDYVEDIDLRFIDKLNLRRIIGVFIGAGIMLLSFYIFSADPYSASFVYNDNTALFIWGAGGMIAALIAGGNIRSGASNGFYAATISGVLVIIFSYYIKTNYFTSSSLADNIAFFAALCVVYLLIPSIFSISGGLFGMMAKKVIYRFS